MKTFSEMTNRQLFAVLAGNEGPIAQMQLQKVVRAHLDYCKKQTEEQPDVDLQTMVREYLEGHYGEVENHS